MQRSDRKRTKKTNAQGRVRTFIKSDLWWLTGFPVQAGRDDVPWMSVPDALGRHGWEIVRLDREYLRRATIRSRWLLENFPRALPATVGDPAVWIAGIERLLEKLKPAVHQGAPLPVGVFQGGPYSREDLRAAERLRAGHPELSALIDALSWRNLRQPDRMTGALHWIGSHAGELGIVLDRRPKNVPLEEQIAFLLGLLHLAEIDGDGKIAPVLAALGDARLYDVPLNGADVLLAPVARVLNALDFSKIYDARRPTTVLPAEFRVWGKWLLGVNPRTRQRSVRLLTELGLGDLWAQSQAWWQEAEALAHAARRLGARLPEQRKSVAKRLRPRLEDLRARIPTQVNGPDLVRALQRLAEPAAGPLFRWTVEALKEIPVAALRVPVRSDFLTRWGEDWAFSKVRNLNRFAVVRREFTYYLRRASSSPEVLLGPWMVFAKHGHTWRVLDAQLLELDREGDIAAFFDALNRCHQVHGKGLSSELATTLAEIVGLVHDAAQASYLFLALLTEVPRGIDPSRDLLETALELTADAPGEFGRVARWLEEKELEGYFQPLRAMGRALEVAGIGVAPVRTLLEHQSEDVRRRAVELQLLQQRKTAPVPAPPGCEPSHTAWIDRTPEVLHPVLEQLAGAHPDAQGIADRALGRFVQDETTRRREIEMLRAKLADGTATRPERVQRRIEALTMASGQDPKLSDSTLARLGRRLQRAWAGAILQRWSESIRTALEQVWAEEVGQTTAPEWFFEPQVMELAVAFSGLRPAEQRLGWQLLARRAGSRPWDWREEPANRRFIERMTQIGIDMRSWVEGLGVLERTGHPFQQVWLALEEDPVEILAMGGHFKTCLSPGRENFFAVVANAVDINKRVLYARDAQGKVVGRCLLALTDQGKILVFYPYCHDSGLGFEDMTREVATMLATRMGASIVANGHVETLVAERWYHDEPEDITGMFACFADGSSLRTQLLEIEPNALVDAVEAALAPTQLDATTLPLLLRLPEITNRPELLVALLPRLERTNLDPTTRAFAAGLFDAAERVDLALRLFGQEGVEEWIVGEEREWITHDAVWNILLRTDPAGVLRALHRTRPRGGRERSWEGADPNRLYYAARAHDLLHRPRRALQLYKQYASEYKWLPWYKYAEQRAAEIAAWLASRPSPGRSPRDLARVR